MSHNIGTGYKGFRSWAVQSCATLKPGETIVSRDAKFRKAGHGVVYDTGAPTQTSSYDTVNLIKQTEQRQQDYKVPDRRGVMAASDARDSVRKIKPFIATTTAANSYAHYMEVRHTPAPRTNPVGRGSNRHALLSACRSCLTSPTGLLRIIVQHLRRWTQTEVGSLS